MIDRGTMHGPVAVPTMDELIAAPARAVDLPPDVARTLLCSLAGVLPLLIAQSSKETSLAAAASTDERFLTVEDVVKQYGVPERWLYRHKRQMPHSQPTRKTLLFPEEKLRRWFASRKSA